MAVMVIPLTEFELLESVMPEAHTDSPYGPWTEHLQLVRKLHFNAFRVAGEMTHLLRHTGHWSTTVQITMAGITTLFFYKIENAQSIADPHVPAEGRQGSDPDLNPYVNVNVPDNDEANPELIAA